MNKHISLLRALLLFLVFFGSLSTGMFAQAFPVTAVVQTVPPFSGSLQNWVDPLNQNIGVTLLLNDRQEPGYQVRLEVTIEGNGIVLRTRQNFMARPISLNFGSPTQLGAAELRPYFLPENLDFTGISRSAYRDLGGLPEGVYSICVRAIDFGRSEEEAASAPTCGFANLQLLDPPVVLSPTGTQTSTYPQFINVQWTPRHIGMFNTNYRVEVYQIPQGGGIQTAEQIYSTQPRFVTLDVGNSFLTQIGPDQQLLDPGFSYLLRVQARDPDGRFRFKNDGYSEPIIFNFETGCAPPSNLTASVNSFDAASLQWAAAGSANSYVLSLQADAPGANTYPFTATGNRLEISELSANTTYKVRIQSVCGNGEAGAFSPEYSFTTGGALEPELADCGTPIDDILPPSNVQPIANLQRGDTVYVSGGFSMTLKKAEKNLNGSWKGFGQVYVPWLGKRINARFDELGVNTERVAFAGDVIAVDKGLASLNGFMTVEEIMQALDTASVDFCGTSVPAPQIDTTGFGGPSGPDAFSFLNDPVTDLSLSAGGFDLPLTLGTAPSTIALFGMRFSPTGASLNAYFSAAVPIANQTAAFQARRVGFGPGGLQGATKLELLAPISFSYGGKLQMTIQRGDETFVSFNCEGLEEVGLAMEVQLCPDVARAVDPYTYEPLLDSYVKGSFTVRASTWGEFSGKMSLSAFELTQLPGWAFSVDTAVLDLSASFTDAAVRFPTDYAHPDVLAGTRGDANPAWQGLYLRAARIRIPDRFTGRTEGNSATVGIENMIVDRTGFTGELFATNIITLEQGSMANWGASIDSVALTIQSNQFRKVNFKGKIQIPALRDPLAYACRFEPAAQYSFEIKTTGDVTIDAMAAQVTLAKNTSVKITYFVQEDEVVAEAILHGRATFGPALGGEAKSDPTVETSNGKMAIPSINFNNFHLISKAPYIQEIGSWSLESDEALTAGFPLTLNEIGMFQSLDKSQVAFGIDLTLNLVPKGDGGFGAEGRAFIICDVGINEQTQRQEWTFNSVRLDKLAVNFSGGAIEMRGYIRNFAGNPEYGTGFQGGIQVNVQNFFKVSLAAIFGKVDGYRYFFVDAALGINPGIPLGPTGLALYGFGGGVSYHMKRQQSRPLSLPISEGEKVGAEPPTVEVMAHMSDLERAFQTGEDPYDAAPEISPLPDGIGQSLSGVKYLPDSTIGIGIKAMVAFGSINRQVFNGDITFELELDTGGGLSYVGLIGNANILTPPKTGTKEPESVMSFYVEIGYSKEKNTLHANLMFQMQYPPGSPILRGAYPQNVVGKGEIHFAPDNWWFYVGTPDQRLAIALDISSLVNMVRSEDSSADAVDDKIAPPLDKERTEQPLGEAEIIGLMLTAYLDAGTVLPEFPPPPPEVLSILDDPKWQSIGRDDPRYKNAAGLMFGSSLKINMPSLKFLMFYGHIKAGIGFDLMLRDYGIGARCAQNLSADGPIGMNGWYATGQLYGYLDARFGIDLSFGLLNLNVEIMQIEVAAILQARLPNPFFMRGAVKGNFSVLNGLVRGQMDFQFSAGEPCDIVDSGSRNIAVIQSITPAEEAEDVSVFSKPQVIFNLPVGVAVPILDNSDSNRYVQVLIQQQYLRVVDVETNRSVRGSISWDDSKTVAAFRPNDILPPNRKYRVDVKVQILQKRPEDSAFRLIDLGGRIPVDQELSSEFTTGEAPDYIPEDNVAYAYPINLQTAFFKEESPAGYVQLLQGQDYLFSGADAGAELVDKLRFTQNKVPVALTDFSYDTLNNRIEFILPAGQLALGTISGMDVVRLPANVAAGITDNVEELQVDLTDGRVPSDSETQLLLNTQQTSGTLVEAREQLVYHLDFRTSAYPTFAAKVAALSQAQPYLRSVALIDPQRSVTDGSTPYLSIFDFGTKTQAAEAFDRYDLDGFRQGEKNIEPLIRAEADLAVTGGNWYNNFPKPQVYDNFPRSEAPYYFDLDWRPEDPFALPPTRAISIKQPKVDNLAFLSDYAIKSGNFPTLPTELEVNYHLPYVMYRDYADYWNQVLLFADRNPELMTPPLEEFIDWDWRNPQSGVYNVTLRYYLPGQNESNSTVTYSLPYTDDPFKK